MKLALPKKLLLASLVTLPALWSPAQILWSSASGSAWLTTNNWTGGAVPTSTQIAQFGVNPTATASSVGINMANNSGLQQAGAIEVTSTRSAANLVIGNSSGSATGVLQLNGATVNGVANVIIRNAGAGSTSLFITNAGFGGSGLSLVLSNNLAGALIDASSPILIYPVITGNSFTKIGTATLTLGASNLFTGNTIISNGAVSLTDGAYLNNSTIILAGGILDRAGQGITPSRANAYRSPVVVTNDSIIRTTTSTTRTMHFESLFSAPAGVTLLVTNTLAGGTNRFRLYAGGINFAGNLALWPSTNASNGRIFLEFYNTNNPAGGSDSTISGLISGPGTVIKNIDVNPGGNVIFTQPNTYLGGTEIRGGFFGLATNNALGFGNITIGWDLNPLGLYAVGAARVLTNDVVADWASASASTANGSTNLQIRGSQNLTLSGRILIHTNVMQFTISNTALTTFSGVVTNAGATSGGIVKAGPGTLLLSGTAAYTGATRVAAGTLALSGSTVPVNSTNFSIFGGATLDVSALSSSLNLGNSQSFQVVNANTSSATLIASGAVSVNLGSSSPLLLAYSNGIPSLIVTGGVFTVSSGSTGTVTVSNGGVGLPAGDYKLIAALNGGSVAGTAPGSLVVGGNGIAGAGASLVISNSELYLRVTNAPVPPSAPVANAASSTNVTSFTASWNAAAGAGGYRLDVATDSSFTSFVPGFNDLDVGLVTSFAVTSLSASNTYFYQVRATNIYGVSGNSATISVTTLIAPYFWSASSGNWSDPASWLYTNPPVSGVNVAFTGAGGMATNDLSALALNSIVFSNTAGAYTISGNALVVSNGLANNSSAPQTFAAPLTLGAAQTFNATSGALNVSGPLTNAGYTLTVNAAVASTNSGNLSGLGGLIKTGASTLLLSGSNTFSGPTAVNTGTLQLAGGAAANNSTVTLANVTSVTLGLNNNETIAALNGGGASGGTVALGANNLSVNGAGGFGGAVTGTGKLVKTGAGVFSLTNAGAIGSSFILRTEGGTTELSRAGAAISGMLGTGNRIDLAGGTLQLSASAQANFALTVAGLDVFSDSTIFFNRTGTTSPQSPTVTLPLTFRTNAALAFGYSANITGGTTTFDGTGNTLQGNATFALGAYGVTIANPIGESGGSFGLTKTGAGQLNLNAVNTYSGPTTNAAGVIALNGSGTFGNGNGLLVLAGGNVLNTASRASAPISNSILMTADATIYGDGTLTNSLRIFPLAGSFTSTAGTLTIRNAGANVTATNNEFRVRFLTGGLNLTPNIILGSALDNAGSISEIEFYNSTNDAPQIVSGNISGLGQIYRSLATGGVTILTGSNTYAGGTLVSGGTLLINNTAGSGTGTNFVQVSSVGIIGGNGLIGGPVTVGTSATLRPGSGTDTTTLTLTNTLTLAGNAAFVLNRTNVQNSSRAAGLTTVTYGGTLSVTNSGDALQAGDTFTLFSAASYVGAFTNIVLPTLSSNLGWTTNLNTSGSLTVISLTTPTALTLTSSANPAGYLDNLTFTATLAPTNATGLVRFFTNGVAFSTNSLTLGSAVSGTLNSLPRGTNLVTAIYGGNLPYLPSTNTLNQIITNHPPSVANASYPRNVMSSQFKILVSNLLTNSTDADGDSLALANFSTSTNGVTLMLAGGYLLYSNPNPVADAFTYSVSDGFGGTNSATVFITVDTAPLFGQSLAINPSGSSVDLSFAGIPGFSYTIVRSDDLIAWTDLWTTNAPPNGIFQFTDTNAPSPSAFYRLRFNP